MSARRLRTDTAGALDAAVDALRAGHVIGLPTETVYGLGVLPQAAPLAALVALKGRAEDKGIALLVDRLDQVATWSSCRRWRLSWPSVSGRAR